MLETQTGFLIFGRIFIRSQYFTFITFLNKSLEEPMVYTVNTGVFRI